MKLTTFIPLSWKKEKPISTGYLVKINDSNLIVVAENISDACDKLESKGFKNYEFIYSRSFDII